MKKAGIGLVAIVLCKTVTAQAQEANALPHVIMYKASAKYKNLVPVQLSEDKKTVVSYPDPADIKTGGSRLLPVLLHNGYWLDKRGVNTHTAFLKLTFSEYGLLKEAPTPEELYKMIASKNAVKKVCDCGVRTTSENAVKELNALIDNNQLKKKCKSVK